MSGTKHDFKKPPINLIPFAWIEGIAEILAFGAAKYGEWNWAQGFAWSRLIAAKERHAGAWRDGEDLDPETGKSHLLHEACENMFLWMHWRFGLGEDDRKKWPRSEPESIRILTADEGRAIAEAIAQPGGWRSPIVDPGFDPLEDATSADVLNAAELMRPASVHPLAETEAAALTSFAWADPSSNPPPPVDFNLDLQPEDCGYVLPGRSERHEIPPPPRTPSETPHLDLEVERTKLIALRAGVIEVARVLESRGIDATDLRRAIMESHA